MIVSTAEINCQNIRGWSSFHDEFTRVFGFSDSYKRNMDAWIDCMSSLSNPDNSKTQIHCEKGKVIAIELVNIKEFKLRCPGIYQLIISSTAFVNWSLINQNNPPVLTLSFHE